MVSKVQQLDKTVVTDFTVQVVDLYLRQKYMKAAVSAKIPQNTNFVQADAMVTDTLPVIISNINTVVVINSWSPIVLDLANSSGVIRGIPCAGLFVMYGQFSSVTIWGIDAAGTRLSYLSA